MTALQLRELIPVTTPIGDGYAIIVELGEHDNYWTVVMNNGALVTFQQQKIRVCRSYTHGRMIDDIEMKEIIK